MTSTDPSRSRVGHLRKGGTLGLFVCVVAVLFQGGGAATYLNKWAVEILGGAEVADRVAADFGFRNLGQIGSLEDYYLFEQRRLAKRSTHPSRHHHVRLKKAPQVVWVEQQSVKRRFKRDHKVAPDRWKPKLNDPVWSEMWYLNHGAKGGYDMNVLGAWQLGYTGRGVVVTILDDGIEHSHGDLKENYDPDASYDFNDSDADPTPRYDKADENKHGTRCAGEVAAVANNSQCGVGVAFRARIGGVRILDGDVVDALEAQALSLNPQHIDIYSASWGPEDNGISVDEPGTLAREAFAQGVRKGRDGKGSIYIWASGNGGASSDSCGCDGYASSVYTLSVSSTSEFGTKPWYLEECSSTLATTYSSGENYKDRKIVTTDLHNRCIDHHTGTSASAPLAAGMVALALEANPELTWRDMQHIVVMTSRTEPLRDAHWVMNAAGKPVSHKYGYGLMDGAAMVLLAEKWTTVPEQHVCKTDTFVVDQQIDGSGITVTLNTDGCKDSVDEINHLEHVQVTLTLNYSRRGDLQIHLISPNGTRSTLLTNRKSDDKAGAFNSWTFMSVFYWGEQPRGTWTLVLENVGNGTIPNSGMFKKWQLIMYGTQEYPVNLTETTRQRPDLYFPVGGESSTEFDLDHLVTSVMSNAINISRSTWVTRPRPTGTVKQKPKTGVKLITKPTVKGGKTTTVTATMTPSFSTEPFVKTAFMENVTEAAGVKPPEVMTSEGIFRGTSVEPTPSGDMKSKYHGVEDFTTAAVTVDVTETPEAAHKNLTSGSVTSEMVTSLPVVCDSECTVDGCHGPGPEHCLVCQRAKFEGRCVRECPDLTFYDPMTRICHSCNFPCMECSHLDDGSGQNCLSCASGYLLHMENNISSCVELCPLEYFADFGHSRCVPCMANCFICIDDPFNCLRCADDFELLNSTCTASCDISEFRDNLGRCQPCDVSCETCSGPEPTNCDSCAVDLFQKHDLCVANCSEGYYVEENDIGLVCEMCHPSCSSCYGPEDNECFYCYHPLKFYDSSCLDECPSGYFESNDGVCESCHEECSACIGPRDNDCIDCPPTSFYFDGKCADNCSEGLFPVEVYNHVTEGMTNRCEVCHGTCRTCSGGLSVDCLRCFKGLLLSSGRCVAQCEPHKYQESDRCWDCNDSCMNCYGPFIDQCLDCPSGRYFYKGHCLPECPHGYYKADGQCHVCSSECDGCFGDGADNCFTCSDGFMMRSGVCVLPSVETVQNCSQHQFYDTANQNCEVCHDSCRTCNGSDNNQCLSCFAPYVLHTDSGRCLPCCVDIDLLFNVPHCCTCDHMLGLCLELWDNRLPEVITEPDVSTSRRTAASSKIPSPTSPHVPQELSTVHLIPPHSSVTSALPIPSRSQPVKHRTRVTVSPKTKTSVSPTIHRDSTTSGQETTRSLIEPVEPEEDGAYTLSRTLTPVSSTVRTFVSDVTMTDGSGFPAPWVLAVSAVLCLCLLCAFVLIVIYCVVQAKANEKVYRPVPIIYRGSQPAGSAKTGVPDLPGHQV